MILRIYFLRMILRMILRMQKRFIKVVAAFFVENASSLLTSYNAINSEYVR